MTVEDMSYANTFLLTDELYPMEHYRDDGIPEFDMLDHDKYDTTKPGKMPFLRFHSQLAKDELLPIPN